MLGRGVTLFTRGIATVNMTLLQLMCTYAACNPNLTMAYKKNKQQKPNKDTKIRRGLVGKEGFRNKTKLRKSDGFVHLCEKNPNI